MEAAATSGKIAAKILSKLNVYNNILSFLDMLARFDQAMHNHSLSLIVSQAKSQMFMGLFTTFSVASDQLTTGQVNSDEVRSFMDKFARPTHGEGWTAVVEGQQDNSVSAAGTASTSMPRISKSSVRRRTRKRCRITPLRRKKSSSGSVLKTPSEGQ